MNKTDSFTNGKPRIATKEECSAKWSGGNPGEYFRCAFCGYKFQPGDYWRWQYTGDIPNASGNPLVCKECDDGPEETRKKWQEKCQEFRSDKWWWFTR